MLWEDLGQGLGRTVQCSQLPVGKGRPNRPPAYKRFLANAK